MHFDINKYAGKYVMHCKTEEEAKSFCNYLLRCGRKWINGLSYVFTQWEEYAENTAYDFNNNRFCYIGYYKLIGYTVLEWEDFMKHTFTKADLKTGDVVKRRNGDIEIFNGNLGMFIRQDCGWNDIDCVRDDLSNFAYRDYDIVAVRRPTIKADCGFDAFEYGRGTLVYERPKVVEMTLAEVCKLLGKEIKIIK